METTASRVVVTPCPTSHATHVHHRDFPEIRAEGNTVREASTHLVNHLVRALDTALTDWRRESINQAIADVQSFLETQEG